MKFLLSVLFIAAFVFNCAAAPDHRAVPIGWTSKDIEVVDAGNDVRIVLHTGGTAGTRLIQVSVQAFDGDSYATFIYQVVQNMAESYKTTENYDVTWTMPKWQFDSFRSKRKLYVLRRDDVMLEGKEVKEIKTNWKTND